jgi:hypothetical protein
VNFYERIQAENELWRAIAAVEREIADAGKTLRRLKKKPEPPLDFLTLDEHKKRRHDIVRQWRAGAQQHELASSTGLSRARIWQIICKIEREEFRALSADPFLPAPKNAGIIRGQEYEFYPEEPDTPIVKLAAHIRSSRDGLIRYRR